MVGERSGRSEEGAGPHVEDEVTLVAHSGTARTLEVENDGAGIDPGFDHEDVLKLRPVGRVDDIDARVHVCVLNRRVLGLRRGAESPTDPTTRPDACASTEAQANLSGAPIRGERRLAAGQRHDITLSSGGEIERRVGAALVAFEPQGIAGGTGAHLVEPLIGGQNPAGRCHRGRGWSRRFRGGGDGLRDRDGDRARGRLSETVGDRIGEGILTQEPGGRLVGDRLVLIDQCGAVCGVRCFDYLESFIVRVRIVGQYVDRHGLPWESVGDIVFGNRWPVQFDGDLSPARVGIVLGGHRDRTDELGRLRVEHLVDHHRVAHDQLVAG